MCTMCPSTQVDAVKIEGERQEAVSILIWGGKNSLQPTHTECISGSRCQCADVTLLVAAMNCRDISIDVLNVRDEGTFHVEEVFGQYPQTLCSRPHWAGPYIRLRGHTMVSPDTMNPCWTYWMEHKSDLTLPDMQSQSSAVILELIN